MSGRPGPLPAPLVARTRTVAEPRWSPAGAWWIESFAGRAEVMALADGGQRAAVAVTARTGVRSVAAYGGGAFDVAGTTAVYVAPDGRLLSTAGAVICRDGRVSAPSISPDATRVAFMLEREDRCDIAIAPIDGSCWPVKISGGADYAFDPQWSPDSATVVWHEWDFPNMPWDGSRIMARRVKDLGVDGPPALVAGGEGIAVGQPRYAPDGSALAFLSDETEWYSVHVARPDGSRAKPLLAEPAEHGEAAWGPGQRSFVWSPDSRSIALCRNEAGFGRLVLAPLGRGKPRGLSKGWHHGLDWRTNEIIAVRSGAVTPPEVVAVPVDGGERRQLATGAPAGLADPTREPEAITWKGDDRGVVHGLFWRPEPGGSAGGTRPPLLVYLHGGPTGLAGATWTPRIQYFVSRGWAVLAPNPRGSYGYGRAYVQALAGRWGELEISDIVAGIKNVIAKKWVDGARVASYGGSAGGMDVLLLAAWHGDLVRAGVDLFGVTDLFDLAESTHRFESRYLDGIVGLLPRDAARYRERSPITYADRINTPLLVLQGDCDPAVPRAQADMLVERLRARNVPVEYCVYEGEGHGWARPETVEDELRRAEAFLTRWVLKR